MAVVGFIIGLGDRHLENILVDETSGEVLHVDFSCLFDKGQLLEYAERVPFRLTQNVIDGFGMFGTSGVFERSCVVAMSLMRKNKETLLSVLGSFVHDPLIEWHDKRESKSQSHIAASLQNMARQVIVCIQRKLDGNLGSVYELQEADQNKNSQQ